MKSPLERQEIVSRRLVEARRRSELSSAEVAERVSRNRSTIHEWESGRTNPTAVDLAALCDVYGCSADWLLGRDTDTGFLAAVDPRCERALLASASLADFLDRVTGLACQIHEDTTFESSPLYLAKRIIKVLAHGERLRAKAE